MLKNQNSATRGRSLLHVTRRGCSLRQPFKAVDDWLDIEPHSPRCRLSIPGIHSKARVGLQGGSRLLVPRPGPLTGRPVVGSIASTPHHPNTPTWRPQTAGIDIALGAAIFRDSAAHILTQCSSRRRATRKPRIGAGKSLPRSDFATADIYGRTTGSPGTESKLPGKRRLHELQGSDLEDIARSKRAREEVG